MHVFVTGATGLIGGAVCAELVRAGHRVTALSRSASPEGRPAGAQFVQGDPAVGGSWQEALAACDACVHLAGEPVAAGRWTAARKRSIGQSRLEATRRVVEVVASRGPSVLVSGSAVGYYGAHGDEPLDEASPPGDGFLAGVCKEWEAAALTAATRVRVVAVRTGLLLARDGGALPRMLTPFRFFAGGPIGKGEFWQSWIHLADEVGMIVWALGNPAVAGPLNATAPVPVKNRDLALAIGRALRRPSVLPVPPLALKLVFGELSTAIATGQRVLPKKALELGFRFRFPGIDPALRDLLTSG
ncbi:MAG: TIGR01777 family protein [Anaeromyxobacter sp. RBG_16_69_14]|nr:MAG: TIGR01777 family protein [Anaeromyxobacter sp. RBG_16_69_14]